MLATLPAHASRRWVSRALQVQRQQPLQNFFIWHVGGVVGPASAAGFAGIQDADGVLHGLRKERFVRESVSIDADELLTYLVPLLEPLRQQEFHFQRSWLRAEAMRLADLRKATTGMKLNLPPSYMLIHRVALGVMGVLCQLDSHAAFRAEAERWLPGFAETQPSASESG